MKTWKEIPVGGYIIDQDTSLENKTGKWRVFKPVLDESKCINCMLCVIYCPDAAIKIKEENGKLKRVQPDLNYCKGCGLCSKICPVKAIRMQGEEND